MTARSTEFFATPEEQIKWIHQLSSDDDDIWCVNERPRIQQRTVLRPAEMSTEMLGNQFSRARLFLGRTRELGEPHWRNAHNSAELDFVRSRAVLFEPSVQTPKGWVAGRLAIMRPRDYAEEGIDDSELVHWYQRLVKSLRRSLSAPKVELFVVAPGEPKARARGSFIVSAAAADAARAGTPLKQFAESNVVFVTT